MKTASALSNLQCQKAAPHEKPYSLADGGGHYLWVTPAGGKIWRWAYRYERKQKLMTFGKYPDVSLAQARFLHAKACALLASGTDPMAQRKEQKTKARVSSASIRHILPMNEQERFQKLYANEQERLQRLYADEKERLDQIRTNEDKQIVRLTFDALVQYLLALKIKPQIIQNEIGRRQRA